jgi:drug/metabolite transporter (DMT)-like permease
VAGLTDLLRQPLWLAGIGAVIVSFLLQAAALATGELAEVQPLMALELPMTLLLASRVFRHPLGARAWLDILVMTGGMTLFLFSLHPTGGSASEPNGEAWAWTAGVTGGVVVLLAVAAYLTDGLRRAALLGAGSGIAFALTAAFMSGALAPGLSWAVFTRWQTYLVAVAGITAVVLLQVALQAGPLVVVQPGVTLVDPLVAVLLGALVFDEHVRTGPWIVGEVIGAVAVGWGAFRLSRSPIVAPAASASGTRDRPPSGRWAAPAADAAEGS